MIVPIYMAALFPCVSVRSCSHMVLRYITEKDYGLSVNQEGIVCGDSKAASEHI